MGFFVLAKIWKYEIFLFTIYFIELEKHIITTALLKGKVAGSKISLPLDSSLTSVSLSSVLSLLDEI